MADRNQFEALYPNSFAFKESVTVYVKAQLVSSADTVGGLRYVDSQYRNSRMKMDSGFIIDDEQWIFTADPNQFWIDGQLINTVYILYGRK